MRRNAKGLFGKSSRVALRKPWVYCVAAVLGILVLVGLYQIPVIHERAYFHLASIQAKIYFLNAFRGSL